MDALADVLTKEQVQQIIDERDQRLKTEIADMIKRELAPFRTIVESKASHEDVDAAITKTVQPIREQLADVSKQLEQLIGMHGTASQQFARIGGMVEALTNVKSSDMQMIRDKQAETDRQLDVFRIQLAGVAGDAQQLMSDVRGAGKGDGNPSLFDRFDTVMEALRKQNEVFSAAQAKHSQEIADMRKVVDADHKLLETIRSFGVRSLRAAVNASWNAFVKQPIGVKLASVLLVTTGTFAGSAYVQGWLEPFLVWLLETVR